MFTEIGKFLRKLRIDNNEILKDMAQKLGMTSSYLSAIECGKRNIPENFVEHIVSLYNLNESQQCDLESAKDQSLKDVSIDLSNTFGTKRNLALQFARTFDNMDEKTSQTLLNFLNKGKG